MKGKSYKVTLVADATTTSSDILQANNEPLAIIHRITSYNVCYTKLLRTQTQNTQRQFGLDGITFDHSGDLYVGDFGDAVIYRLKLSETGTLQSKEIYSDSYNFV